MQTLNVNQLIQKKFIGADELRRKLTKILSELPKNGGGIVITQNGRPKGVLVDIKTYLRIQGLEDEIADYDPKLIKRINKALEDVKKNGGIPAEKVWEELGI